MDEKGVDSWMHSERQVLFHLPADDEQLELRKTNLGCQHSIFHLSSPGEPEEATTEQFPRKNTITAVAFMMFPGWWGPQQVLVRDVHKMV